MASNGSSGSGGVKSERYYFLQKLYHDNKNKGDKILRFGIDGYGPTFTSDGEMDYSQMREWTEPEAETVVDRIKAYYQIVLHSKDPAVCPQPQNGHRVSSGGQVKFGTATMPSPSEVMKEVLSGIKIDLGSVEPSGEEEFDFEQDS